MHVCLWIVLASLAAGENVIVNGDFSDWPTYDGTGITTTTVGVDRTQFLTHWYGGPGVGGTATYDVVDFPAGQTDVPGGPAQHLRITWHTPPAVGEEQHADAFRSTFLEYFGLQDVRLFSGKTVLLRFYGRVVAENPEATLDIVPIMWHSYDPTNPVKGEGYELFESSGTPGVVAVAHGAPNARAACTLTTRWQLFEVPIALPDVSEKKITPGHYTGLGFDQIAPQVIAIDLANVAAWAADPVSGEERLELFDEDPDWEGINNRRISVEPRRITQDFGYDSAVEIGGATGSLGGRITPDARAAYYGKVMESLSMDDAFSASGVIRVKPGGGNLLLGFFNSETLNEWRTPNTLAFRINGRGTFFHVHTEYMTRKWRAGATVIGQHDFAADRVYPIEVPSAGEHTWSLAYDPAGNGGSGAITATFDGERAVCNLDPGHRKDGATFDRFGLLNVIKHVDDPGEVYIGDLVVNGEAVDLLRDPHWDTRDNRVSYESVDVRPRFDFGFSNTNFAGGVGAGEIGGLFFRGDCRYPERLAAYGAPVSLLTLAKPLRASGKVTLRRGVTDSTTLFGYYHGTRSLQVNSSQSQGLPEHFLGFSIEGPSSEGFLVYPSYRAEDNGHAPHREKGLPAIYPDGASHDWSLDYKPASDGAGSLTFTFDETVVTLPVIAEDVAVAEFNRFGFVTPWIDGNGQVVYLDDIRYTVSQ